MKRNTFFRTLIEIIVILGFITIGVTAITYVIQPDAIIDKTFISLIIIAVGACGLLAYLSLTSLGKLKNIPSVVAALLNVALGIVLLLLNIDLSLTCIIWGIASIGIQAVKITNSVFGITEKTLTNGIKIIVCLVEIAFCVILIIRKKPAINGHVIYMGIALFIEAFLSFISLIMHRE